MVSSARYAIYFAPDEGQSLWQTGIEWLGRDPAGNAGQSLPAIDGLDRQTVAAMTAAPRFYGFHATLKPPFCLRDGIGEDDLIGAVETFARAQAAFTCPPLTVQRLGRFLALMLSAESREMSALADSCVRDFDRFRAPLSDADMGRRRAAELTDRQERYLLEWGYPYVFEEFQFHMSLTGGIDDERLLSTFENHLCRLFASLAGQPQPVDAICVFSQPDRETSFRLHHRARLIG